MDSSKDADRNPDLSLSLSLAPSSPSSSPSQPSPERPITPPPPPPAVQSPTIQHIHHLTHLDALLPDLLTSASHAIRALTQPPSTASPSPAAQKAAFESHTTGFYTHIQALAAHLRRQTYLLEEAGLISPNPSTATTTTATGTARDPTRPTAARSGPGLQSMATVSGGNSVAPGGVGAGAAAAEPAMQLTNGGLGALDVGWLNSRRDTVGAGKEAELWGEARRMLEGMLGKGEGDEVRDEVGAEGMDEDEGSGIAVEQGGVMQNGAGADVGVGEDMDIDDASDEPDEEWEEVNAEEG